MEDPVEYMISYKVKRGGGVKDEMRFSVYMGSQEASAEIHRIKALTRALLFSDEFTDVKLVRKHVTEETVEL